MMLLHRHVAVEGTASVCLRATMGLVMPAFATPVPPRRCARKSLPETEVGAGYAARRGYDLAPGLGTPLGLGLAAYL